MTIDEAKIFIQNAMEQSRNALAELMLIMPKVFATKRKSLGEYYSNLENCKKEIQACEVAVKALEELQQYRAIGTPEECRAAVERNNEKTRIIDGVTECCGYYVGPGVFQVELLNPALFAEGKLKGAMKNEIICGKCGCAGLYVKIKEFPNKMDVQGKAKETWNRRVNDGKMD